MKKAITIIGIMCAIIGLFSQNIVIDIDGEAFDYSQLDILAIGDSNLYSAFSPKLYYKLYHEKSYVMANPNQSIEECYQYLSTFLQHVHPRIVVFEVNPLYCLNNPEQVSDLQVVKTHQVVENMQTTKNRKDYLDGYGFYESRSVIPGFHWNYMRTSTQVKPISEGTKVYFDKIVKLCENENIELVLLSVPSIIDWSTPKHNLVSLLADDYHLKYIDFNLSHDIHINWLFDTRDGGIHLNNNGANKVTTLLGQLL